MVLVFFLISVRWCLSGVFGLMSRLVVMVWVWVLCVILLRFVVVV